MSERSAAKFIWIFFFGAVIAFALRFIEPYSAFKFNALSLCYLISAISCIYFGITYFGWASSKKQKACIILFAFTILSVLLASNKFDFPFAAVPLRIIIMVPIFLSPIVGLLAFPILLGLSHKSMAFKNNWLLYPLTLGPTFDFMARAAAI